jgi:hypothetical protein
MQQELNNVGGVAGLHNQPIHPQSSMLNQNCTTCKSSNFSTTVNIPIPRVGGINEQMAWTGGSNLPMNQYNVPWEVNQYRPSQYKSAKMAAEGACKGVSDDLKLSLPSKKQNVRLPSMDQ